MASMPFINPLGSNSLLAIRLLSLVGAAMSRGFIF
jgi:hypothetical protein